LRIIIILFLLFSASQPSHAIQQSYHEVTARQGAKQPLWLIEPDQASHTLVLFAGGKGSLKISGEGIKKQGNFLVRSRNLFVKQGFNVAIVDKPADQVSLKGFRTTRAHVKDIAGVVSFLRERNKNIPVWLVGTSRGTISATNAAAQLHNAKGPDGIVLTASVTETSNNGADSLHDVDLSKITVPTLVVHHKHDECYVTPYTGAIKLIEQLTSVSVKKLKGFIGGKNEGDACRGKSYHGFTGIEEYVVDDIAAWIKLTGLLDLK